MGHRDESMDLEDEEVKRKHTERAVRKRLGKVGSLWGLEANLIKMGCILGYRTNQ